MRPWQFAIPLPLLLAGCLEGDRWTMLAATSRSVAVVIQETYPPINGGLCIVIPHENEATSLSVARAALAARGGTIVRVHQQGDRSIVLFGPHGSFRVDPNRITSRRGVLASFRQLNGREPLGFELNLAQKMGESLVQAIDCCLRNTQSELVIALHNNRDSLFPKDFSILSFGSAETDATVASVPGNPRIQATEDPDNFFLVTQKSDFDAISERWNVVLQAEDTPDDGSLSWKYRAARYVNVEAEHGSLVEQAAMLFSFLEAVEGSRIANGQRQGVSHSEGCSTEEGGT